MFGVPIKFFFFYGWLVNMCQKANEFIPKQVFLLLVKVRVKDHTFSEWFFHKNVLFFKPSSIDKVSMSQLISFSKYQTKLKVLIETVDDIINFKIFLESTSKEMADRENKRGRQKHKNLKTSRTKRAF